MIDVVIVNWNSGEQLKECVASVLEHGKGLVTKVIVVDNDSVDGSDISVESLTGVTLYRAGSNLGFGKGCNVGALQTSSNYLLFLNPDASVYSETLQTVLAYMERQNNQHVGICGVQLLDEAGHVARSCSRFPSVSGFFAHGIGLDRLVPRLGPHMAEWSHTDTSEVDQVIGAFFFVRRSLFEQLNGFDERFFVYFEEVDFSYRAHEKGWESVYLADAHAYHKGGGTSDQVKATRLFYSWRSRLKYVNKHFSMFSALWIVLLTLLIEPLSRLGQALLKRSLASVKETWGAYKMLWSWFPGWLYKGRHK